MIIENNIGAEGARVLSEALIVNSTLKTLHISGLFFFTFPIRLFIISYFNRDEFWKMESFKFSI